MRWLFVMLALLLGAAGPAQYTPPTPPAVRPELDGVFAKLNDQLKAADDLVKGLRGTANKTTGDTQRDVLSAAGSLSQLVDRLGPNGDIATTLDDVSQAAAIHQKRVMNAPEGSIEEQDRTDALTAWERVTKEVDTARTTMSTMRTKLSAVLERLRKRQAGISELLLAGQYEQAVKSLNAWLTDLQTTVDGLHQSMTRPRVGT